MDGFVHKAEVYAKGCTRHLVTCSGASLILPASAPWATMTRDFLNYYYYMASQFAVSDRWFSPIAEQEHRQPHRHLYRRHHAGSGLRSRQRRPPGAARIPTIFQALDQANVSWKIYYTVTQGYCGDADDCRLGPRELSRHHARYLTYSHSISIRTIRGRLHRHHPALQRGGRSVQFLLHRSEPHRAAVPAYFTDLTKARCPALPSSKPATATTTNTRLGPTHPAGPGTSGQHRQRLHGQPGVEGLRLLLQLRRGRRTLRPRSPGPGALQRQHRRLAGNYPRHLEIAVNPDGYTPCVPFAG